MTMTAPTKPRRRLPVRLDRLAPLERYDDAIDAGLPGGAYKSPMERLDAPERRQPTEGT
jgi:hypothetical protein